jgi:uncharacterized membrane-anchored protein
VAELPEAPEGREAADRRPPGLREAGDRRAPGWREVLIVAVLVVGVVFAIQVLTSLLPTSMQEVVFHTPLAIIVLVVGTLGLLLRIAGRRPS